MSFAIRCQKEFMGDCVGRVTTRHGHQLCELHGKQLIHSGGKVKAPVQRPPGRGR